MNKPKNYYIRYKRAELENYVKHDESCVKKVTKVEKLIFNSNVINNFKQSILRILSRKIGKYDQNLEGVILDFRNTKILNVHTGIRYDSPYSVINVETNFYIFRPRKNAIVDGIVKHINVQKLETIISVVIYRVFNVKVTFKGCIKKSELHHNKEIKLQIKEFHFNNEIPYIEGELINPIKNSIKKNFDDILDSGISESSIHNELRNSSSDDDDEENENFGAAQTIKMEKSPDLKVKKQGKRKNMEEYDFLNELPPVKKIKQELVSDDEFDPSVIKIKQEKDESSETDSSKRKKKKHHEKDQTSPTSLESSKKYKKKKKKQSIEEDFESSLQLILNTSIVKQEKD